MTGPARLLLLAELALIAFLVARARARAGLPRQHGWYALSWTLLPPALLLLVWTILAPAMVTGVVLASDRAAALPAGPFERAAILAQARAGDIAWHPLAATLAGTYARAQARADWLATALMLVVAGGGWWWSARRLRAGVAPRPATERLVVRLLALASVVAVLATAGIVATLLWESARFFAEVSPAAFLFGTHWSPQVVDPADPGPSLGALPLFWGSFVIGVVIAMAVAVPVGLLAAIWLAHYAPPAARAWLRPAVEILAGIPSVIYGWYAVLALAPAIRALGVAMGSPYAAGDSALAAGLVMGVIAIPYVASSTDDALRAVPAELSEGSLALGATTAETVCRVLLPAAAPGIVGGVLLAVSRTVGETMIAVIVASAAARVSLNPFAPATTVTRQIVDLLTGETTFDSPRTLAAFALGLTLFAVTLLLNLLALRAVRRFETAHA